MSKESQEKYVKSGGMVCPVCGSMRVEAYGDIDTDAAESRQAVMCRDCESTWVDVYILRGYEDLVNNRKE